MVDIDHFKRINDEYNHHTGDHVLQQFTIALSAGLRRYDSLARFGGEEFLITMPHTGLDKAMKILERLRTNLEAHPLPWKGGRSIAVTASFGLTEMTAGISIEEALERADHALLCAKATGRNRVCVWGG
jgi:diguanylate cyclase (GGDEF)-like protein